MKLSYKTSSKYFISSVDYEILTGQHTIYDLHVFINYIRIYKR